MNTNVNILKVNTSNVRVMKVVDMYVMKGLSPSLFGNYKRLKTYFKLQTVDKGVPKLLTITFDVPTPDIASGRVHKGANILVEKFGEDSLKYLGAEGDWETMLSFGYPSNQLGILPDKFKNFSEESRGAEVEYIEDSKQVSIHVNGETVASADFSEGAVRRLTNSNRLGRQLLNEWLESRGYTKNIVKENGRYSSAWEKK